MSRHGLPAANTRSGRSLVTTLPAPMMARDPMLTPARISAPPPTQTSSPIVTGCPYSCFRLKGALFPTPAFDLLLTNKAVSSILAFAMGTSNPIFEGLH